MDALKNFALATASTGYDASATSVVLTTGHGARFPTTAFYAVWWNSTDYANPADDPNVEVVRVTARSTDTLTVTRAQEGTSASTKNTGGKTYKLTQAVTAALLAQIDFLSPLGAAEIAVTGATTATVGRMHLCSGTSADYTLTLPAASGNTGQFIGLRMSAALTKLVTIDGNNSETIDGSLTRVMWAQESALLFCDGSNWFKISGKSRAMMAVLTRAAAQSCADNTVTKILFDTANINVGGLGDIVTNNRVDIRRAGKYFVSAYGQLYGFNLDEPFALIVQQSSTHVVDISCTAGSNNQEVAASQVTTLVCTVGQNIDLHFWHNAGEAHNTSANLSKHPQLLVHEILDW